MSLTKNERSSEAALTTLANSGTTFAMKRENISRENEAILSRLPAPDHRGLYALSLIQIVTALEEARRDRFRVEGRRRLHLGGAEFTEL